MSIYLKHGKRLFDFVFAFMSLIILIIPIFVIAIVIKVSSPGPIFFVQNRVGKDGKIFNVIKFRTMKAQNQNKSPITVMGDKRITKIGNIIRKWKLDEIPQLWNVLKGKMSIVGPRPDVPGYADKLKGDDRQILLLRPGITGPSALKYADEEEILAQVEDPASYNDEIIYPDKVQINLKYLHSLSFKKDVSYICETFLTLFKKKRNIYPKKKI